MPEKPAETKKINPTIIIAIVVGLILIGGISSWAQKRSNERKASKILSDLTGSKVEVTGEGENIKVETKDGTMTTGTSASWPSDMPSIVPKFTSGTISSASTTNSAQGKMWIVMFTKAGATSLESYKGSLESAGWTSKSSTDIGLVNMISYTKDTYDINVTYSPGEDSILLTVSPKY